MEDLIKAFEEAKLAQKLAYKHQEETKLLWDIYWEKTKEWKELYNKYTK